MIILVKTSLRLCHHFENPHFKVFLMKKWGFLTKISNITVLLKQTLWCDLRQRFSNWRQVQKLVFTRMLKVLLIYNWLYHNKLFRTVGWDFSGEGSYKNSPLSAPIWVGEGLIKHAFQISTNFFLKFPGTAVFTIYYATVFLKFIFCNMQSHYRVGQRNFHPPKMTHSVVNRNL